MGVQFIYFDSLSHKIGYSVYISYTLRLADNMTDTRRLSNNTRTLLDDESVIRRIFDHIDNNTTDMGSECWQEPVGHYQSQAYFEAELSVLRKQFTIYCPSSALEGPGAYLTSHVHGTPIVVVRTKDGTVNAFRNACRHRGVQVAEGCGHTKSFVCPYHAWTYGLDGSLRGVPHEHGFPELDKSQRGLVPIVCKEENGLIFVCIDGQDAAIENELLSNTIGLIPETYRVHQTLSVELPANWKIVLESFLEGYHIRATHTDTFFPLQFDNLNVVEQFGRNSRLCFPYRAVEKLRSKPASSWNVDLSLTYVYHLFPNILISNHPGFKAVVILEPVAVDRTKQTTYIVTGVDADDTDNLALVDSALAVVNAAIDEDRQVIMSGQRGLAANANQHLEFGLFESSIVHFHSTMKSLMRDKS